MVSLAATRAGWSAAAWSAAQHPRLRRRRRGSRPDGRHGRRPSRHRECVRARPRPGRRRRRAPPRAARPCPAPPLSSSSTAATTPPQQRSLRPAGPATVRARPARARPRPAARWRAAPPPSSSRTRSSTSSVRAAPAPPPDSPSSGTSSRTGPRCDHTRCSPLAAAGPHRARLRTSASTSSTAGDVPRATSNSPRPGPHPPPPRSTSSPAAAGRRRARCAQARLGRRCDAPARRERLAPARPGLRRARRLVTLGRTTRWARTLNVSLQYLDSATLLRIAYGVGEWVALHRTTCALSSQAAGRR